MGKQINQNTKVSINTYICRDKVRDKNNRITAYILEDTTTKGLVQVAPTELKNAIYRKSVVVKNLTLTSDGRLIDKTLTAENSNQAQNQAQAMVEAKPNNTATATATANKAEQKVNTGIASKKLTEKFFECMAIPRNIEMKPVKLNDGTIMVGAHVEGETIYFRDNKQGYNREALIAILYEQNQRVLELVIRDKNTGDILLTDKTTCLSQVDIAKKIRSWVFWHAGNIKIKPNPKLSPNGTEEEHILELLTANNLNWVGRFNNFYGTKLKFFNPGCGDKLLGCGSVLIRIDSEKESVAHFYDTDMTLDGESFNADEIYDKIVRVETRKTYDFDITALRLLAKLVKENENKLSVIDLIDKLADAFEEDLGGHVDIDFDVNIYFNGSLDEHDQYGDITYSYESYITMDLDSGSAKERKEYKFVCSDERDSRDVYISTNMGLDEAIDKIIAKSYVPEYYEQPYESYKY